MERNGAPDMGGIPAGWGRVMASRRAAEPARAVGFPPLEPKHARILVLGSLPGEESIRKGEYYGHPRNAFWRIMGEAFGAGPEKPYAERLRALGARGVMLWDVLRAARRRGSLDADIRTEDAEPNDVAGLAARHPELEMVAFNGAAAEALFRRHVLRGAGNAFAGVEFARLPSTSPANAGKTEAEKTAIWRAALAGNAGKKDGP